MQPYNSAAVNTPAFLNKLWKIVNDPSTNHLIKWGPGGENFVIENKFSFWNELLPAHYKHNNMSSFIRQLNMYGFHKVSSENRTEADKDELIFYHSSFKKGHPELLKLIKRKNASTPRSFENRSLNPDDPKNVQLTKVLVEVAQLKGKQGTVDDQLVALKHENAVLWRELALLRQKHLKQQQIVNKLIQFLITMVQPSRMGGLGVKRKYPLMLSQNNARSPKIKKPNSTTSDEGPTIHELEPEGIPDVLFEDDNSCEIRDDGGLTDPDIYLERDYPNIDSVEELISEELPVVDNADIEDRNKKIFLNPTTQDTLLSNLMNGSYNTNALKDLKVASSSKKSEVSDNEQMTVATRDPKQILQRFNSLEDMDFHVETTEAELNQLQELLNGYTSFDANALLGLFNDDSPEYHLTYDGGEEVPGTKTDSLISGSELTAYEPAMDYSQLFNDSSDEVVQPELTSTNIDSEGSIVTPQFTSIEPAFPQPPISPTKEEINKFCANL